MKTYIIGGSKVTIIPPQITDSERDARLKQIEATIRALLLSLNQKKGQHELSRNREGVG